MSGRRCSQLAVRLLRTARFAHALRCAHSLAHFAHSLARETVNDWMAILSVFFSIFDYSGQFILLHFSLQSLHSFRLDEALHESLLDLLRSLRTESRLFTHLSQLLRWDLSLHLTLFSQVHQVENSGVTHAVGEREISFGGVK